MRFAALALCFALAAQAATVLRIAAGAIAPVTDSQGNVWAADSGSTGGANWTSANQASMSTMDIPYRSLRYSSPAGAPLSYRFTLPTGQYQVTLKFAEPNKTGSGQRQFAIQLQGSTVAALDLFAATGAMKPWDLTYRAVTTDAGLLMIDLAPSVGNAVISAIQIDTVEAPPPPATAAATTCERTLGNGSEALRGDWVYSLEVCVNTTTGIIPVLRVLCRSDAPAVMGLMVRDANNQLQNIVEPFACAPEGAEAPLLPGASYTPGQTLLFVARIIGQNPPPGEVGYGNARQVLMTAVLGQPQAPRLASLKECSGSGPAWDCAGLYWAKLLLANGAPFDLVGVSMVPSLSATVNWTDK